MRRAKSREPLLPVSGKSFLRLQRKEAGQKAFRWTILVGCLVVICIVGIGTYKADGRLSLQALSQLSSRYSSGPRTTTDDGATATDRSLQSQTFDIVANGGTHHKKQETRHANLESHFGEDGGLDPHEAQDGYDIPHDFDSFSSHNKEEEALQLYEHAHYVHHEEEHQVLEQHVRVFQKSPELDGTAETTSVTPQTEPPPQVVEVVEQEEQLAAQSMHVSTEPEADSGKANSHQGREPGVEPVAAIEAPQGLYALSAIDIDGNLRPLSEFRGKLIIVVNVASACGYTDENYKGLTATYNKYKDHGLEILGFPCNQFGSQEPGSEADIKSFCHSTYNVSFPIFAKVDVNGPNAHPVYKFLKESLPVEAGGHHDLTWNFNKFLVNKHGMPVKLYSQVYDRVAIEHDIYDYLSGTKT